MITNSFTTDLYFNLTSRQTQTLFLKKHITTKLFARIISFSPILKYPLDASSRRGLSPDNRA